MPCTLLSAGLVAAILSPPPPPGSQKKDDDFNVAAPAYVVGGVFSAVGLVLVMLGVFKLVEVSEERQKGRVRRHDMLRCVS